MVVRGFCQLPVLFHLCLIQNKAHNFKRWRLPSFFLVSVIGHCLISHAEAMQGKVDNKLNICSIKVIIELNCGLPYYTLFRLHFMAVF